METIEISGQLPRGKWGIVEKVIRNNHCKEYNIKIDGNKTIILVPDEKTKGVYSDLVKKGIIQQTL